VVGTRRQRSNRATRRNQRLARPREVSSRRHLAASVFRLNLEPLYAVGVGRFPISLDVRDPRFRADHGRIHQPPPSPQTFQRSELRHLLVLSAQAGLRSARGADPVPPLEPAVAGDDRLRLRKLRLATWRGGRLDHLASDLDDGKYASSWYENAPDVAGAEAAVDGGRNRRGSHDPFLVARRSVGSRSRDSAESRCRSKARASRASCKT
jgi:hypothetical protein